MLKLKYPVPPHMPGSPPVADAPYSRFDLERLNSRSLTGRLFSWLRRRFLMRLLLLLQLVWPRFRFGRVVILTRHADIVALLADSTGFEVPYGPEMRRLTGGADFMLATDGERHRCLRDPVAALMDAQRTTAIVEHASHMARALLANSGGEIDAARDYFMRISSECACRLLGLSPDDPDRFGDWTLAVSALVFGDPFGRPETLELADHAAWRLRAVADQAIRQALEPASRPSLAHGNTLLADLLLKKDGQAWKQPELRALLIGTATGVTPTLTLLCCNILNWLLARPKRLEQAIATAALSQPDRAHPTNSPSPLLAFLREAARFVPALDPGQFRVALEGARLPGTNRPLPAGTVVLAATAAALRDPRAWNDPSRFLPGRSCPEPDLVYGAPPHACIGSALAEGLLEAMFLALLSQPGLARAKGLAGRMRRVGPFASRLRVTFDLKGRPRGQTMATFVIPAPRATGDARTAIEAEIRALDTSGRWQTAMAKAGIVHFASLSLFDSNGRAGPEPHLLLELSTDGRPEHCLAALVKDAGPLLEPLLERIGSPPGRYGLAFHLESCRLNVHRWPWGATGLDFNGQSLFSVHAKAEARGVVDFATRALDAYLGASPRIAAARPLEALQFIRALIRPPALLPPGLAELLQDSRFDQLRKEGAVLKGALWRPGQRGLPWIGWHRPPRLAVLWRFLRSRDALPLWIGLGVIAILLLGLALLALAPPAPGAHRWLGIALLALTAAILLTVMVVGLSLWRFWSALRRLEKHDWPDTRDPARAWLDRVTASEDRPAHVQNHFLSVSTLKTGLVRRLTLALAMWGIENLLKHGFPLGFASDIGTIHTARWVRFAPGNNLLFASNYDGSWESYLEDFIMLAFQGQNAAWSNAQGFPPTSGLIGKGAQDGNRFKRWVRLQQRPTGAWYSRFPDLSMERIRRDAEILDGLAHAATDAEARRWLSLFGGSATDNRPDLDEVQTVVLAGRGRLTHGLALCIAWPSDPVDRNRLLQMLIGGDAGLPPVSFGLPPDMVGAAARAEDPGPLVWIGFTARGLTGLGLPPESLATFDLPFQVGMRPRSALLGLGDGAGWDWSDADFDALLTILAPGDRIADFKAAAISIVEEVGGTCLAAIDLAPVDGAVDREPFGFADGISQPILAQVHPDRAARYPDDVVAPGEILFGHPANDGHVLMPPRVQAEADPFGLLADAPPPLPGAFPAFRDLGRNGSMVAIQQFSQDSLGFWSFCEAAAKRLVNHYPRLAFTSELRGGGKDPKAAGASPGAVWVAAKLIGRWPDGTPLVESPAGPRGEKLPANRFRYAEQDPAGLRCPLGAHIRRANPRDALEPIGPLSLERSSRHRILRRGRAWQNSDSRTEGLLFVGLGVSLERQFEFIQRSWLAAHNFSALEGEADPILGPHPHPPKTGPVRDHGLSGVFTIPTDKGPLRVTGMQAFTKLLGGAYLFLPGRSGLAYLGWLTEATAGGKPGRDLPGFIA